MWVWRSVSNTFIYLWRPTTNDYDTPQTATSIFGAPFIANRYASVPSTFCNGLLHFHHVKTRFFPLLSSTVLWNRAGIHNNSLEANMAQLTRTPTSLLPMLGGWLASFMLAVEPVLLHFWGNAELQILFCHLVSGARWSCSLWCI